MKGCYQTGVRKQTMVKGRTARHFFHDGTHRSCGWNFYLPWFGNEPEYGIDRLIAKPFPTGFIQIYPAYGFR